MAFTDTLEWPECNSDKATVAWVVCTVYTDGQRYKLCVLCQTGFRWKVEHALTTKAKVAKFSSLNESHITKQLLTSISVDIRIYLPLKVIFILA